MRISLLIANEVIIREPTGSEVMVLIMLQELNN